MNKIVKLGNPSLRKQSTEVPLEEIQSDWIKALIKELFLVMEETGGVGVAAPQIGLNKRVIVFGTKHTKTRTLEYHIPNSVLINPKIKIINNNLVSDYEGCLSLGEIRGVVPRASFIQYSGYDENGNYINKEADELEARIIQHEVDHLDGILFIDRIVDIKTMAFASEM